MRCNEMQSYEEDEMTALQFIHSAVVAIQLTRKQQVEWNVHFIFTLNLIRPSLNEMRGQFL